MSASVRLNINASIEFHGKMSATQKAAARRDAEVLVALLARFALDQGLIDKVEAGVVEVKGDRARVADFLRQLLTIGSIAVGSATAGAAGGFIAGTLATNDRPVLSIEVGSGGVKLEFDDESREQQNARSVAELDQTRAATEKMRDETARARANDLKHAAPGVNATRPARGGRSREREASGAAPIEPGTPILPPRGDETHPKP